MQRTGIAFECLFKQVHRYGIVVGHHLRHFGLIDRGCIRHVLVAVNPVAAHLRHGRLGLDRSGDLLVLMREVAGFAQVGDDLTDRDLDALGDPRREIGHAILDLWDALPLSSSDSVDGWHSMNIVLISTYDLGHQPFGLASPAAWLRAEEYDVTCLDLSVEMPDEAAMRAAGMVAFYLPMHTATRLAAPVIERVRYLNPDATLCAYGLYAPVNEAYLRRLGIDHTIGGEFENPLVEIAREVGGGRTATRGRRTVVLEKQRFRVPDRADLPGLADYADLTLPDGTRRIVGYTEASRGCKHLCRHCPVVPVYGGRFFVVQRDVVLADIARQVEAGAQHITFGDPDFLNGPGHARAVVEALHGEHPTLTYDVTVKVEHLHKHAEMLRTLRDTGCLFVTSAFESLDDRVLAVLDKGHTRADALSAVEKCRAEGLVLVPTFVAFTPWLTLEAYEDLLETIVRFGLVEAVAPVQLAIRLLIPDGSRLLELAAVRGMVELFDEERLCYPWRHPDPRVDALQRDVEDIVGTAAEAGKSRAAVFIQLWERLQAAFDRPARRLPEIAPGIGAVPQFSEPWYCCAEPM